MAPVAPMAPAAPVAPVAPMAHMHMSTWDVNKRGAALEACMACKECISSMAGYFVLAGPLTGDVAPTMHSTGVA